MLNLKSNNIEQQFLMRKLKNQQAINELPQKEALAAKAMQDHLNWYAREIATDTRVLNRFEQSFHFELNVLKKANKTNCLWQQLNAGFHKLSATMFLLTK